MFVFAAWGNTVSIFRLNNSDLCGDNRCFYCKNSCSVESQSANLFFFLRAKSFPLLNQYYNLNSQASLMTCSSSMVFHKGVIIQYHDSGSWRLCWSHIRNHCSLLWISTIFTQCFLLFSVITAAMHRTHIYLSVAISCCLAALNIEINWCIIWIVDDTLM